MTQPNLSETYPAQSPRLAEKFRLAEQLQNTIDAEKNPNHVQRLDGSIHHYVEPLHIQSQMEELVRWINDSQPNIHPIHVAAVAHYNMV